MKQQTYYGYGRKSSKDKEAEAQLIALQEVGVLPENIFVDQPIGREKLEQLINCIEPDDVLVIKSLRQLGHSYKDILNEWTIITNKRNAHIRVLEMELLDTSVKRKYVSGSFISDIFLQIISFAAQQERIYIKQRQAEGIAYARLYGKHLGRPRILKPVEFDETYDMWRAGAISAGEAMSRLNLKRSTFDRLVKERKEELKKEAERKAYGV